MRQQISLFFPKGRRRSLYQVASSFFACSLDPHVTMPRGLMPIHLRSPCSFSQGHPKHRSHSPPPSNCSNAVWAISDLIWTLKGQGEFARRWDVDLLDKDYECLLNQWASISASWHTQSLFRFILHRLYLPECPMVAWCVQHLQQASISFVLYILFYIYPILESVCILQYSHKMMSIG